MGSQELKNFQIESFLGKGNFCKKIQIIQFYGLFCLNSSKNEFPTKGGLCNFLASIVP